MTTSEGFDSSCCKSTPLSVVWQSVLGSSTEGLIDFLQTLNDEWDTQPERMPKTISTQPDYTAL